MTSYPNNVWDGDSKNRDSDDAPRKAPDARDWIRLIEELAETQRQLDARAIDLDGKITVSYVYAGVGNVLILEPGEGRALQADSNGNARGNNAVDLQRYRVLDTEIASGNQSVICGGYRNAASAAYAAVLSGSNNGATGNYNVICGGQYNDAAGTFSTICGGHTNVIFSGDYGIICGGNSHIMRADKGAICGGTNHEITIDGTCSFIGGSHDCTINDNSAAIISSGNSTVNCYHGTIICASYGLIDVSAGYAMVVGGTYSTAKGDYSIAIGNDAISKNYGEIARSLGKFTIVGDAQTSLLLTRRTTTNATNTTLRLDEISEIIALDTNRSYVFCAHVVGHNDIGSQSAAYRIEGCIFCKGTTYTLKNTITTVIYEDDATWDSFAWVGSTPAVLHIYVKGATATTINWLARIELTQVGK